MARPLSEDKRNAILLAATEVIAEQGISAPTSRITRVAAVAEGSLFTYFATKDELLNQLYLEIKTELAGVIMRDYPLADRVEARARHIWFRYVQWGVDQPVKRRAMLQLAVSERILPETRSAAMRSMSEVNTLLQAVTGMDPPCGVQSAFAGAIMGALAETTIDFMTREPAQALSYAESGFMAFWRAVGASAL
jgi:AcrR family transcriptional regulator